MTILTNLKYVDHFDNFKDNPGDLWHLKHWLKFWPLKIWIDDLTCRQLRVTLAFAILAMFLKHFHKDAETWKFSDFPHFSIGSFESEKVHPPTFLISALPQAHQTPDKAPHHYWPINGFLRLIWRRPFLPHQSWNRNHNRHQSWNRKRHHHELKLFPSCLISSVTAHLSQTPN